jgi:integrase/recombinase XerD
LQHRGLAPVTVDRHVQLMKQMLPARGADAGQYTAATVRTAVLDQIRGRRPACAKTFVGALRIHLRFPATSGACQPGLDHALPAVAEWKLSALPRRLDSGQTARLTDACRRDGRLGLRDRAIMLLLLRLGLRAGEVDNVHHLYRSEHWTVRKIERHPRMSGRTIKEYLEAPVPVTGRGL